MVVLSQKVLFYILKPINLSIIKINDNSNLLNKWCSKHLKKFSKFTPTKYRKFLSFIVSLDNVTELPKLTVTKKDVVWSKKKQEANFKEVKLWAVFKKMLTTTKPTRFKILKNVISVKPYNSGEYLNIGGYKKMLIRNSRCFSKTKYSFIRQECKNIVYFTLLLNIVSMVAVLNIYLKWSVIISFIFVAQLAFIVYNFTYLFGLFTNLKNLFKVINF